MAHIDKFNKSYRTLTRGEEIINSSTHGVGVIFSSFALAILIVHAKENGNIWHLVSFIIFGFSMLLLYLSSTLYHITKNPSLKQIFAKFDHAAIFFLIAGTYTPFLMTSLRGPLGWWLFGLIWGIAITGAVFRTIFHMKFRRLMVIIYLLMGWMFLVAVVPASKVLPPESMIFLIGGGISYSVGVIFYVKTKMKYSHGIWHLFVLGGSVSHFFSVLFSVG
jgi:hemolysin III